MALGRSRRRLLVVLPAVVSAVLGGVGGLFATCGPFSDVAGDTFCPLVLEIFYLGITTGTTATTFAPSSNVSRLQMAAFLSRTVDRTLQRGSRRAAMAQNWAVRSNLATTTFGQTAVNAPYFVASDGADLWVSSTSASSVQRVRGSDGKLLETWTGAQNATGVLAAMGQVFVAGKTAPGGSTGSTRASRWARSSRCRATSAATLSLSPSTARGSGRRTTPARSR